MEAPGQGHELLDSRVSRRRILQAGTVVIGAASAGLMACGGEKDRAEGTVQAADQVSAAGLPYGAPGDWDAITDEATDILSRFIAIDTTNPPGAEEASARFLGAVLERDNIGPVDYYDAGDGRVSMSVRLPGDGSKGSLILLNHTDVVPADAQYWDVAPFAGEVRDGEIWGRGALDMKSMGVMELVAVLLAKRMQLPLKRDIVFLAVADEEAGSERGIGWLALNHPEVLEADFVLNEGGWGRAELLGVRRTAFECAVGEKGPLSLRLVAHGTPGHGSAPGFDNAVERLVGALARVLEWRRPGGQFRPATLVPETSRYFEALHSAGYLPDEPTAANLERVAVGDNAWLRLLLLNTANLTTTSAGTNINVVPAVAEATLDCRLLPGVDAAGFKEELQRAINDPKVDLEVVREDASPTSPVDTELYAIVQDVVREHVKDAVVLPSILTASSDSKFFRKRGVVAYGLTPGVLELADLATIHGNNERISVANLRLGCQVLFEVVRRLCA